MQNNSSVFDKIKVGDLIFTRSDDWMGYCIRFITNSEINHVGIYIGDGKIIESQLNYGVRELPLEIYLNDKNTTVFQGKFVGMDEYIVQGAVDRAKGLLNSPYDLIGQLGILVKIIAIRFGLTSLVRFYGKNVAQSKRGYWCSELIAHCFEEAGFPVTDVDQRYATPEDLAVSKYIDFGNLE